MPADAKPADAEKKPPEETVLLAFVGAAPTVRIAWTPKAEGAAARITEVRKTGSAATQALLPASEASAEAEA